MSTNTRYITACGLTPEALDKEVKTRLREGLRLYGDPYSAVTGSRATFCQALVGVEAETMAEQIERAQAIDLPEPVLPAGALER